MPRKRKPKYSLHKATGQARVRLNGKDHYLGAYGSPESRQRYDDLVAEWYAKNEDAAQYKLTIDDLAILYVEHAKSYYRKPNGEQTTEGDSIRLALRPLIRLYGRCRVHDFGPKKLKRVQESLIESGHCRTNINRMVKRIKRMFKWGVSEEHVTPVMLTALSAVEGLRKGRSEAVESEPVEPVDDATVEATLPHMSPILSAMVQLQRLTGARPGEISSLRPCDITFGVDGVWRYTPEYHKSMHRGKQRRIHIGPKAQEILRPFLDRGPEAFCFSPKEAVEHHQAERRRARKSPMTPSQAARKPKPGRKRVPADRYNKDSYRRAVERACERAFGMPRELRTIPKSLPEAERKQRKQLAREWRAEHCWTPNQLRHNRATLIRERYGIEAAQVVLGHSDPKTTEIYAERDFSKAAEIMREIG